MQNNAQIVRELIKPETRLMAVVKSNAYSHGLVETAKIFANPHLVVEPLSGSATKSECFEVEPQNIPEVQPLGADWLGVDNIDEAILLRESGIKNPILVLGYTPANRIKNAANYNGLRFTIYDPEILKQLSKSQKPEVRGQRLHLKVDTGMSRQGVLLSDLPKFLTLLRSDLNKLLIEGVYTHFANADNLQDRKYPNLQLANFKKAIEILKQRKIEPQIVHASATTGLLTMPEAHYDMVRVGIALYGLWPSGEFREKLKPLKIEPALSWKTRTIQIKKIKKGTSVGYGITERVKKDTRIAVLPVGYYDGYMRALSGKGEVLIGGKRCRILGRISMNLSVVDASNCPKAKISDEVVLIGTQGREKITAEELAEKAGTISYEIVSRINPLLPRIYKE